LTAIAVNENDPPDPRNVYAATKLHQEHLSFAYGREHDSDVVALQRVLTKLVPPAPV